MRFSGLFLLFFFSFSCLYAKDKLPSDFRRVNWGMKLLSVMALEDEKPQPVFGSCLSYKTSFLDREVFLLYNFTDNKLVEARYVFDSPSKEDIAFISRLLEEKYGEPLFKDENDGHVRIKWESKRTSIDMSFETGKDGRIVYTGRKISDWLESRNKEESERKRASLLKLF